MRIAATNKVALYTAEYNEVYQQTQLMVSNPSIRLNAISIKPSRKAKLESCLDVNNLSSSLRCSLKVNQVCVNL